MNHLDALDLATHEFGHRLALVNSDHWDNPTPCADWNVRYLVAHVVGGNRFSPLVLNGETAHDAIEVVMTTPQLGDEPYEDFTTTSVEQRREFRVSGRLERPVDHPVGPMTAARFLSFRIFDITLHAWDLAIGIGADTALNDDLIEVLHQIIDSEDGDMGFGIDALNETVPNASSQEKLLDLTGRRGASRTQ